MLYTPASVLLEKKGKEPSRKVRTRFQPASYLCWITMSDNPSKTNFQAG
jgi:hypothetical protein